MTAVSLNLAHRAVGYNACKDTKNIALVQMRSAILGGYML